MYDKVWHGFYKKSIAERHKQLCMMYGDVEDLCSSLKLPTADNMIENCVGYCSFCALIVEY
jgi:hydroxymethylglutaryl-CoA reductase